MVTVKKLGGSAAVVIPNGIAREMQISAGTVLHLSTTEDAIVMRRQPRRQHRRKLATILKQIKPQAYRRRRRELGDDGPVGREAW